MKHAVKFLIQSGLFDDDTTKQELKDFRDTLTDKINLLKFEKEMAQVVIDTDGEVKKAKKIALTAQAEPELKDVGYTVSESGYNSKGQYYEKWEVYFYYKNVNPAWEQKTMSTYITQYDEFWQVVDRDYNISAYYQEDFHLADVSFVESHDKTFFSITVTVVGFGNADLGYLNFNFEEPWDDEKQITLHIPAQFDQ